MKPRLKLRFSVDEHVLLPRWPEITHFLAEEGEKIGVIEARLADLGRINLVQMLSGKNDQRLLVIINDYKTHNRPALPARRLITWFNSGSVVFHLPRNYPCRATDSEWIEGWVTENKDGIVTVRSKTKICTNDLALYQGFGWQIERTSPWIWRLNEFLWLKGNPESWLLDVIAHHPQPPDGYDEEEFLRTFRK